MHVTAASVLPLESQPIVSGSTDSSVEGLEKLHDSMVQPVGECWVVDDSLGVGVRVVGADESCRLWPLEVCCTKTLGRPGVSIMESRRLR